MKPLDPADIRGFIRDYRVLMRPYRWLFASCIVWIALMQVTALAEPYAIKYIVDFLNVSVANKTVPQFSNLLRVLFAIFLTFKVGSIIQIFKNWRINKLVFLLDRDVNVTCAKKLLGLPLTFHERENSGLLISKVNKGISKSIEVTAILLYEIISLFAQIVVTGVILWTISLPVLAIFAVTVMVFTIVTYYVKQKLAPMRKRRHDEDEDSVEKISEDVNNVATVQAFGQEVREFQDIKDMRAGIFDRAMIEFRTHFTWDFIRNLIVNTGRLSVISLMAWDALNGRISVGTFVLVISLSDRVFIGCYRIGAILDRVQEASESLHRMMEILNTDESVKDPVNPVDAPEFEGRVTFEHVTHQYKARLPNEKGKRTKPALSDICLDIRPGETIGIVGPSGGGKSTLVKMLLRADDPTEGRVAIDGINLKQMNRADVLRQFGYVSQDVQVFKRLSIAENIAFGCRDASREDIIAAAKVACLHDFIMTRVGGYDGPVSNHGMNLSGGQKQRLGIARAVLMNAKILILDEATSSVDSISEAKIQDSTEMLRTGRTTIIIAHRLSTVQNADRIVVMDEGRIRDIGTHDELKAKPGLYADLIRFQHRVDSSI